MKARRLIAWALGLALAAPLWASRPGGGDAKEGSKPSAARHYERRVNFGMKGGFTSTLFRVSSFSIGGVPVDEVQNNYKIGYFGSFFLRINLERHFLQPEASYAVNRCDIAFMLPAQEEGGGREASIQSSIHSLDIPIIYGYNIIKDGPYSLAAFGGPKLRYAWKHAGGITYTGFGAAEINEEVQPLNLSFTLGVAVTIAPVFFDFRYDIGLTNLSKDVIVPQGASEIRFHRRDNVLSFSLGVLF